MAHLPAVAGQYVQVLVARRVGEDALVGGTEKTEDIDGLVGQGVGFLIAVGLFHTFRDQAFGDVHDVQLSMLGNSRQPKGEGAGRADGYIVDVIL